MCGPEKRQKQAGRIQTQSLHSSHSRKFNCQLPKDQNIFSTATIPGNKPQMPVESSELSEKYIERVLKTMVSHAGHQECTMRKGLFNKSYWKK
jgi:hypothetical protein